MRAPLRHVELAILVGALAIADWFLVPCHVVTMWADGEFTGWVSPIANRMVEGHRLYGDGLHSPLAPLPFVFFRAVVGPHATWWSESFVNSIFQALAIVTLFLGMRRDLPGPVPFLAAFATIPAFLFLQKSIAYDAMAQASVALVAALTLAYVTAPSVRGGGTLALATATAVGLLIKQNTGTGAAIGAGLALLVFAPSVGAAFRRAATYTLATLALTTLLLVAMKPWIDLGGFLQDVLVTGSEPKGGPAVLLGHLGGFCATLGRLAWTRDVGVPAAVAAVVLVWYRATPEVRPATRLMLAATSTVAAVAATLQVLRLAAPAGSTFFMTGVSPLAGAVPGQLVAIGLVAAFLATLAAAARLTRDPALRVLAVLTCVTLLAALCHNLSVAELRWNYDNNPVIQVAYATIFLVVIRLSGLIPLPRVAAASLVIASAALQWVLWTLLVNPVTGTQRCQHEWPGVPHLAGARMTNNATAFLLLVNRIRNLAPRPTDTVLLLPSDPDVEAWFERPRPPLTAAIIFPDQYWPRLVDTDLARLAADPPQVIAIGPENMWGWLSSQPGWAPGARDLIERVRHEILPQFYRGAGSQVVPVKGGSQMDEIRLYVRRTRS